MRARSVLAVAALALLLPLLPAAAVAQEAAVEPERIEGATRVETAAAIAPLTYAAPAAAVLVTGEDFPDALAGSFAAGRAAAPLLLAGADAVPEATLDALEELGVSTVVLVGGEAALGEDVEATLADAGYDVQRVAGADRFATAAAVATAFGGADGAAVGELEGDRTALLASGESFPDALAAGPIAARAGFPLLLTPRDRRSAAVDGALEDLGIERIVVVGGDAAVSSALVADYAEDYAVERFAGPTRTGTAATVAENAVQRIPGFTRERALLARGDDFPDALAASAHGAVLGAPILLTASPTALSDETADWLAASCPDVTAIRAIGGTAAVTADVLGSAVDAADRCRAADEAVATFTTSYTPGESRNRNIQQAARYIDGDVIPSGATYSLDDAIGDRTRARGFVLVDNGCIGADGEPVDCVGGGVSQVATTFMNAAWFAGIELLEFRPHTTYFERYPMCREATLIRGRLDVLVRNDTPHALEVAATATESDLTISLVGQPWADVASATSAPYDVEGPGGAFSVDCSRTITTPDGEQRVDQRTWRYSRGFPG
jgi:putative cell wall-binding protein